MGEPDFRFHGGGSDGDGVLLGRGHGGWAVGWAVWSRVLRVPAQSGERVGNGQGGGSALLEEG